MLDRFRFTAADGATLAALASHQGRQELFLRRRPDALALIHENAAKMPLDPRLLWLLLQLHQRLTSYSTARGGAWKSTNNEIQ